MEACFFVSDQLTGTCTVDVTYQNGSADQFQNVTNYSNDGTALTFKGQKKLDDGSLGPIGEWYIPIAGNVQSVVKRDDPDPTT